ncbi:DHH family phosphoesterase [Bacillus cereus]|uniref:DDH domain-containing protein n=1 Tax=Bacillus cereus TaxID=1396 RepID=A0ABD4LLV1_BACCE|nr:DHH family phosphoesterase [Bacillus cereus]MBK1611818.1 hypothetical protein [Bacillus cereus]
MTNRTFKVLDSIKVKLFTHTDLDGIGCEVVGRLAFKQIDVEHCDYHNVDDKVKNFLTTGEHKRYDMIIITDISVKEPVADMINATIPDRVVLLDHHETAKWMNHKYEWANVRVEGRKGKDSGTNLLFEHLSMHYGMFRNEKYYDALSIFVEKVRRYDCWEWKTIYNDTDALLLNNLLYLIGRKSFANKFYNKFMYSSRFVYMSGDWTEMFDSADKAVLEVDREKAKAYFDKKEKQMFTANLLGHKVGVVFAEQYISELGNILNERHKDLDLIAIVDMGNKKVSYRTIHDHVNVSALAKTFGGGGHVKASGSEFEVSLQKHMFKLIFGIGALSKVRKLVDMFTK